MHISIHKDRAALGREAAARGVEFIRNALARKGEASIIVATGSSQFEVLSALVAEELDWTKVTGFHLDEYVGLPQSHPASFRKYLKERFVEKVPLKQFHYVNGEGEPAEECRRLGALMADQKVDVAFIGIGENGHLAFNDPPADFKAKDAFLHVELDERCRLQQMGEGWFPSLEDVPPTAISMSIPQILKSEHIICSVPDLRKAEAVKCAVEGPVHPRCPASILRQHASTFLFLDRESASLLHRG
jgi:glucosamine-6-phosphate deaminase